MDLPVYRGLHWLVRVLDETCPHEDENQEWQKGVKRYVRKHALGTAFYEECNQLS
jgi:hypothetical protein